MIPKTTVVLAAGLFAGLSWSQVELNQASEIDLDGLKGFGPAITRQVLTERQKAPFKDWRDLRQRIKGLGHQKATQLSAQGAQVNGIPYEAKGSALSASEPVRP